MLAAIKLSKKFFLVMISPKFFITLKFYKTFHRLMKWKNPHDLNEKINWLKLYSDTSLWTRLADKYLVREYVRNAGFGNNLTKLYGKYNNPNEIEWEHLPNEFVIKTNNGCGDILLCKDKSRLDKIKTIAYFKVVLQKEYANYNCEPHYAQINPCIVIEELLDAKKQAIKTDTLIDYKIWCFNGMPHHILVCCNRQPNQLELAVFDLDWKRHDELLVETKHYKRAKENIPRPKTFDYMLRMAKQLSQGISEVRVDLYEINNKVYFGEMTFTAAGGYINYYSMEFLDELGDYVNLAIAPKR